VTESTHLAKDPKCAVNAAPSSEEMEQ
jgi:hypothetical protein